jgi:hypothetical protein
LTLIWWSAGGLLADSFGGVDMRTLALVVLLVAAIPAWASGPKMVVKAEPKPEYDGIRAKFKGNVVGFQMPKLVAPLPFVTSRELIMLSCPDLVIANRLFGGLSLPRSGFSRATDEALETIRQAIFPRPWGVLETFDGLRRLRPLR